MAKANRNVFIVVADDGAYGDYATWLMSAWFSEKRAHEEAARLQAESDAARAKVDEWWKAQNELFNEMFPGVVYGNVDEEDWKRFTDETLKRFGPQPDRLDPEFDADLFRVERLALKDAGPRKR